jgi:aldehyde:ferredoxin oxidoreductase
MIGGCMGKILRIDLTEWSVTEDPLNPGELWQLIGGSGWNIQFQEFLSIGERVYNLKRRYNVKCGINRKDDTLPGRILNLKREGLHAPERLPDQESMLNEYYRVCGWDENGIPRKETISKLGLEYF